MELTKLISKQVSALTVFTAVAYGMAYSFQKGIAYYYGYPDLFIKIDLNTLLYSSVWLIFFTVLFLGGIYLTLNYELKDKYYVTLISLFVLIFAPVFLIIGFNWPIGFFPKNSVMGAGDTLSFCILFFNYYNMISIPLNRKRSEHHAESIRKEGRLAEYVSVFRYVDWKTIKVAVPFGIFTLFILSNTFGKVSSYKNEEYYIVNDNVHSILINSYSNGFVIGSCEENRASFEFISDLKGYTFRKLTSRNDVEKIKKCFEYRVALLK